MWRDIARGGLLTGAVASIAATVFCLFHLGKNDPWGLTAAAICLLTWAVSLMYWACDCGLRMAAKRSFLGSRTPSRDRPRHRYHINVMGTMGVVLGAALLCTVVRPFVKFTGELRRSDTMRQVFMGFDRGQLHQRLASGDPSDAYCAAWALHEKGFSNEDRGALAEAFLDARLPISTRSDLGSYLTFCPRPFPDEFLAVVAGELDSMDPESQVLAAEVLSQIAPDAPAHFEVDVPATEHTWTNDGEKYRTIVDLIRRWWAKRQARNKTG
jgi:hypothetical protein